MSEQAVQDYQSTLKDLNGNNKLKINVLTILSEDYAKYSSEIVDCIVKHALEAPNNNKLPFLYLIDSICKNVLETGDYAQTFARHIVKLFKEVFQKSDDRTRASMYKLRNTWANVFPKGKLYMLDLEIHGIDPNWPVASPRNTAAKPTTTGRPAEPKPVVHVNPRFKPKPAATVPAVTASPVKSAAKVVPAKPSSQEAPPKAPVTLGSALKLLDKKPIVKPIVKLEPKETPAPAPVVPQKKITELGRIPKKQNLDKDKMAPKDPRNKDESVDRIKKVKKEVNKRRSDSSDGPKPKRDRKAVSPVAQQSKGESWKTPKTVDQLKPQPQRPTTSHSPPNITPTGAPGSHAFNLRPQALSNQQVLRPNFTQPPLLFSQPAPFQSQAPFQAGPPPSMPPFGAAPPRFVSGPGPSNNFNGPPSFPPNDFMGGPPPFFNGSPGSQPPPNIRNETPRLPHQVAGNNRIFVEGKAYEVFYLDNTAVIERNGVPHRISFCGPPRDIIIDGRPTRMAFGETKEIVIDGHKHYLRFGAPSRELYMGDFAFRGAFGGPPIVATINGKKHEIRLMGVPPEVKIDQDPCYELMRHMQNMRQSEGRPSDVKPKEEKKEVSIDNLLASIEKAGILSKTLSAVSANSPPVRSPAVPQRKSPSPPLQRDVQKTVIIDKKSGRADLDELFSIATLNSQNDTVDAELSVPRHYCWKCGIEVDDVNSASFRQHIDEHISLETGNSQAHYQRTRPLYQSEDDFVTHTQDLKTVPSTSTFDNSSTMSFERTEIPMETEVVVADLKSSVCTACCEPFQEHFDDDLDEWTIKDGVIIDDKPYHRSCIN